MALLERVSALIRANLNDLIDRAEDPQKMLRQVTLDMQNQLLQVKTQVAIAIAESKMGTFDRMKNRVHGEEAMSHALAEMAGDSMEDRLDALGKDDEVERMLAEIKDRRGVAGNA